MSSTKPAKVFALVDCNNFYVSCERAFNLKLKDKPVIVLSNNDGCVIARSNEAKALNIPMGAPFFQYKDLIERNNVKTLSSNFSLYGDMSMRVMQALYDFGFPAEIYSIDEAFLEMDALEAETIAPLIIKQVLKWTSIPVSIGIGITKTLAKVAAKKAKKEKSSFYALLDEEKTGALLKTVSIDEVWGIGSKSAEKLRKHSIYSAYDLAISDDRFLKKTLTITGLKTALELRGVSCLQLDECSPAKQSITSSQSFSRPISSFDELKQTVASFSAKASEKLRKEKKMASYLIVFALEHPFKSGFAQSKALFKEPTNYTPDIIEASIYALLTLFKEGTSYRKTGIILGGFCDADNYQQDLFSSFAPSKKKQALMRLVDTINQQNGARSLFFAQEGTVRSWKMKRENRSNCYTTKWEELLTIKI